MSIFGTIKNVGKSILGAYQTYNDVKQKVADKGADLLKDTISSGLANTITINPIPGNQDSKNRVQLSGRDKASTGLTTEDFKKAKQKSGKGIGTPEFEHQLFSGYLAKDPSQYADILSINSVGKPLVKQAVNKVASLGKDIYQTIAESKSSSTIANNLSRLGIEENAKNILSKQLTKIEDPERIRTILKNWLPEPKVNVYKDPTGYAIPKIPDVPKTPRESVGFQTYQVMKEPKSILDNPEAGFASLPTGLPSKINKTLNPIKETDQVTQDIYSTWTKSKTLGKELANEEMAKIQIPENQGMQSIIDYQKTGNNSQIKQTFDNLYETAASKGIDVPYREKYLPQVYANDPTEVEQAVVKFLKDNGVSEEAVKKYIDGIEELPPEITKRLKLNPSFSKQRVLPDYETAMKYGLTPKYSNPSQLAAYYRDELEKTAANRKFISDLIINDKIKTVETAPKDWKAIDLPFSNKGYYAEPQLAETLNGLFRDENNLTFGQEAFKKIATLSKKMQEITLSAGIPRTSANFFSYGQLIKHITSGDFGAIPTFIRSNFEKPTLEYFEKNRPYLKMMANQGFDMSQRIGTYETAFKSMNSGSLFKRITGAIGRGWEKAFNEKTFASFIPQLQIQTFKDAYKKALDKGMGAEQAESFAAEVTRNFHGLLEDTGRSKGTEDVLSATFFAPKFREGIINTLLNTARSVTTEIRNPAFYKNRRLVAGMAITYGLYNALNKKLNGSYMWENESGREFALKVPMKNGDIAYVEFMPSFLAFARNMASGAIGLARGDFKTAAQKFGSVFSMPVKLTSEVVGNKDYFGRQIYSDNDDTETKLKKIAIYLGLQVNHPYIRETVKQLITDKDKPVYQSVSEALEFPLKFSSKDKLARQQYYEMLDKQEKIRDETKKSFKPAYDEIQSLIKEGKEDEAQKLVNGFSDMEYELYKDMKASDKTKNTNKAKSEMFDTYLEIQELIKQGKQEEAQTRVNKMSDEEYRIYQLVKKQLNK